MDAFLKRLRDVNPGLHIRSVHDGVFSQYGRLLDLDGADEINAALCAIPIPREGNRYIARCEELERTAAVRALSGSVFGGMETQAGFCNGQGRYLNALEYHKCPEVDFSATGAVLFLAQVEDIHGGQLDSADIVPFWLPPGQAVELYPYTLHFAPCKTVPTGFNCMVLLEKGVNTPLEEHPSIGTGEDRLLFMKGKWLIAHPDSPSAAAGAYVGITGNNYSVNTVADA